MCSVQHLLSELREHSLWTYEHSLRVANLAIIICGDVSIRNCALLHDIGKLEIDASILDKQEYLTIDEWDLIKLHPYRGACIASMLSAPERKAIYQHHENVDGTGYYGEMELCEWARILRIADTIDAMHGRHYHEAATDAQIQDELLRYRGVRYDSDWVDCVLQRRIWHE